MAEFSPDDITGPCTLQNAAGLTAYFYFAVALPGGAEGHAIVGTQDGMENSAEEPARFERVAAALNFHVAGHGYDAVVTALRSPEGFSISLTGF